MTEPYHKDTSPLDSLPKSLRFILETLMGYKKSVHKMTLKSQSPQVVAFLLKKLDGAGTELLLLLDDSNYTVNIQSHPDLQQVFDILRLRIRDLSGRDRIILRRWIEQMFFQNPLTADLSHIENLAHTWFQPEQSLTQQQNDIPDEEVEADASREMS